MPKVCYIPKKFNPSVLLMIDQANEIMEDYSAQGFDLTLRQLYYQFVSRGLIENKDKEYKRLGGIISDARLAGLIDWDNIVDRTRNMKENGHWDSPQSIIKSCAQAYRIDKWLTQPNYVEVWIEKDALVGVLQSVCPELDVPYFSCRGYTSQSEMWSAAMRLMTKQRAGKSCHIIHLGDHDPSGIDMSRDIEDRLLTFMNHHVILDWMTENKATKGETAEQYQERVKASLYPNWKQPVTIHRIALNWDQVEQYEPPPNPAKVTDSRAASYMDKYGDESWELDALEPAVLVDLVRVAVNGLCDDYLWFHAEEQESGDVAVLHEVSTKWTTVQRALSRGRK